jgi:hypothetical protein
MWQMNVLACALDDFILAQLIDRIIIQLQHIAQNFVSVLAQQRWRQIATHRCAAEF